MKILSLFDGMACGHIAMQLAGVKVDRYVAYEIDKYAIKTAQHNFHDIEEKGDVFATDFTEYTDFDFLVGGSPCTYWSIAQSPDKRETTASGIGWELFSQYVRALKESKPRYFIYENNKSMAKEIKDSITETFGFEPIMINSALVSAQNRQRLYWVGRRNTDGTYAKVNVEQPTDRGILLKDILDSAFAWRDKSFCLCSNYNPGIKEELEKHKNSMVAAEVYPVNETKENKSGTLCARYYKTGENPFPTFSSEKYSPRAAEPIIDDVKINVYTVENGQITVKGKQYQIKLKDGKYIIRKLTVDECKRLQTVPEWYDFSCVSNSQAYKMLGNGWTCEVIKHLIESCLKEDE